MFKWCFKKRVSTICHPIYTTFKNADDSDIGISGGDYK